MIWKSYPRLTAASGFRVIAWLLLSLVLLGLQTRVADSAFPGQNGKIAFIRADFGDGSCPNNQIWTMDKSGGSLLQLAPQLVGVFGGVAWSPDGQKLAFTIQTPQHEPLGVIGVLTVNADGTGAMGLANLPIYDNWKCSPTAPTWSPDGTKIAVGSTNGIAVIDLQNPNAVSYLEAGFGSTVFSDDPAWSPGGGELAVAMRTTGALGLIPATGGKPTAIPGTQVSPPPRHPSWSPEGNLLVFERSLGGLSIADLCVGGVRQLTVNLAGDLDPAWSPDGKLIAYWSYGLGTNIGDWDIFTQSPDGGPETNLTNTRYPIAEMSPDWQPTGDPPPLSPCGGHTFIVRSIGNAGDVRKGDGKCDTGEDALPDGTGKEICTLRAAIEEANQTPARDVVEFALTGTPRIEISPDDPLPDVEQPVEINGTTQPGTGRVEIVGPKAIDSGTRRPTYPGDFI